MADTDGQHIASDLGQTRIYSACIPCQKRKKRCDGSRPVCELCTKLNTACVYTERKRRGLGKGQGLLQRLEHRLETIEASNKAQPASDSRPTETKVPTGVEVDSITPSGDKSQLRSDAGFNIGLSSMRTLTEFTANLKLSQQRLLNGTKLTPFAQPTFISLLPKMQMIHLIQSTWDEMLLYNLLFTPEAILDLLNEQYEVGPDSIAGNPSRWSIINSVIASAMVHKTTNDYLTTIVTSAWAHFKNAFATFPELLTQGTDIHACEALLAMALFLRSTVDARTASQVINAAVRLIHIVGLHNQDHDTNTEGSLHNRRKRVVCVAYILDAEMVHKYGLPSAFTTRSLDLETSGDPCGHRLSSCFLQSMIGLATVQLRVHEALKPNETLLIETEAIQTVASLDKLLQDWTCRHESLIQSAELTEERLLITIQTTLVNLTYHSTIVKAHMKLARFRQPFSSSPGRIHVRDDDQTDEAIQSSWLSCISSSRDIIRTMRGLESHPFHCLWELLGYPLSATLLLLSAVLEDPQSLSTQMNVVAIAEFIQFLEDVQRHGSNVQVLLAFCRRLREAALLAIHRQRSSRALSSESSSLPQMEIDPRIESLRKKLFTVSDWLNLAQGLLSNIPILRRQPDEIFSSILGDESVNLAYNACVPNVMQLHHQSFTFGS